MWATGGVKPGVRQIGSFPRRSLSRFPLRGLAGVSLWVWCVAQWCLHKRVVQPQAFDNGSTVTCPVAHVSHPIAFVLH